MRSFKISALAKKILRGPSLLRRTDSDDRPAKPKLAFCLIEQVDLPGFTGNVEFSKWTDEDLLCAKLIPNGCVGAGRTKAQALSSAIVTMTFLEGRKLAS